MHAADAARLTIVTRHAAATEAVGEQLGALVEANDVLLLSGDLGAGKTQLTKGLAVGLGVVEPVTSPTFNIMLVHEGRLALYHIDLYRLDTADQLEEIGYSDAIEGEGVAAVEWGDRFPEARPAEAVEIGLHIAGDEERRIEVVGNGPRGRELVAALAQRIAGIEGATMEGDA